jgi:hypothetical protein
MEIKVTKREFVIEGVKCAEYTTIATPETLEALRLYSGFGDSHRMRVGDTVLIREEHVSRRGTTMILPDH